MLAMATPSFKARGFNGHVCWPSEFHAIIDQLGSVSSFRRPLRNRCRASVYLQSEIVGLVVALLLVCGPAAVARFVVASVVDSVDGMLQRQRKPHVFLKIVERLPSRAHSHSSSAVLGPAFVIRVFTALSDPHPAVIEFSPQGVWTSIKHNAPPQRILGARTAARSGRSCFDGPAADFFLYTAPASGHDIPPAIRLAEDGPVIHHRRMMTRNAVVNDKVAHNFAV